MPVWRHACCYTPSPALAAVQRLQVVGKHDAPQMPRHTYLCMTPNGRFPTQIPNLHLPSCSPPQCQVVDKHGDPQLTQYVEDMLQEQVGSINPW